MARNEAYQRAEQKIEQARRSGAKKLDLNARWDARDSEKLSELPESLGQLTQLAHLVLDDNPLNPELAAAYEEGIEAVKRYLRAKAESQVVLNEAKLIMVGEGAVAKSCLLGALRGDPWEEDRLTTHGIEIKPVKIADPATGTEITLNGWDFGGQPVYRPTHQLFFSAPAIYLVVWKPREGPQQGFVKEWIKLVKHREPDAKILVVATHGGPKERQPDLNRQEIWDLFGNDTVIDFFRVDSKPLKDEETREKHGLVKFSRLDKLWNDKGRDPEFRYPAKVHPMFVALMERFDLSYQVAGSPLGG